MDFLRRIRRPPPPSEALGSEPEPTAAPVLVTFWTAAGSHHVETVAPADARLSDILNDPQTAEMFDVPIKELLIVLPPPQPTNPARRLHRPGQLIHLSVGPYEVSGSVHVPSGVEAIAFMTRHRQRFVALRRATIEPFAGGGESPVLDVVLVNFSVAHSTRKAGGADS